MPDPDPADPTADPEPGLVDALHRLDRAAAVQPVDTLPLQAPLHHPQGLVRAADRWWLSTVDVERVEGHLLGFDDDGELVADLVLTDGPRFHPGGIDVLDDVIVVPVAEYRPDSTTALVRVDLATEQGEVVGRVEDHLGALSSPRPDGTATTMTWGSRQVLTLDAGWAVVDRRPNPSHWIDVQDVQRLDDHRLAATGVAYLVDRNRLVALGGLGVWDEDRAAWTFELPLATTVGSGRILTNNPVWLALHDGGVALHAVPDDDDGSLLTYRLAPST